MTTSFAPVAVKPPLIGRLSLPGSTAKARATAAVAGWFSATVVLILTNKVLMREHFRLPVFLTFLHMLASNLWCHLSAYMRWSAKTRTRNAEQAGKIFLLSQMLALSVVLAVASFKYVEVSLEQALAASTPAFTALMSIVILGKREKWRTWVTLMPIMGGATLSAGGEPSVSVFGVCLIFSSNLMRATKSCMQELLLQGENAMDSINLLRHMSLYSMVTLLPAALVLEGPNHIAERVAFVIADASLSKALFANCCGAFLVNLMQFIVTEHVGALSMQVLGNVKSVFTSVASVLIFRNEVTTQGVIGYSITTAGAYWYGMSRHQAKEKEAAEADAAATTKDAGGGGGVGANERGEPAAGDTRV